MIDRLPPVLTIALLTSWSVTSGGAFAHQGDAHASQESPPRSIPEADSEEPAPNSPAEAPPSDAPAESTVPTVAERIDRGKQAYDRLEYSMAADELMIAAGDGRATPLEKVEANLWAGMTNRILERDVEARLNFRYVLLNAPDTRLPEDAPPKIRTFFELVRADVDGERRLAAPPPQPKPAAVVEPDPKQDDSTAAASSDAEATPLNWPLYAGLGTVGVGSLLLLGAAALATTAEIGLAVPAIDGATKDALYPVGWIGLGIVGLSIVPIVAGAGLVVWGVIE